MEGSENNVKPGEQAGNEGAQKNKGVQGSEGTLDNTGTQDTRNNEAKFTQAEFEQALRDEVARKTKGMPSKEDLKAFEDWKEAQKTAEEKQKEEAIRVQNLQNDYNSKTQIIDIMKKGVDYDAAEFIQFKLSKMKGEFSDNLESYFKENPVKKEGEKKVTTTGFSQSNTGTSIDQNKDYLDKKYANNPYYKK